MAIVYDVSKGDAAGGPIDYATVVASVSGLTYTAAAPGNSTRTRYGVRARDTVSGLSDRNTDAAVLVTIGAAGQDLGGVPAAPIGLSVAARAGGTALVRWDWPYPAGPKPTGFHVYEWPTAGAPSYITPAATVPHAGRFGSATLSGLAGGTSYTVAVRAYDAAGEESNTATAVVVASSTPPANVSGLTATPVAG